MIDYEDEESSRVSETQCVSHAIVSKQEQGWIYSKLNFINFLILIVSEIAVAASTHSQDVK